MSDSLELELHMVVSHHVDAWNQTHPGSPKERPLIIEPSLQPSVCVSYLQIHGKLGGGW